AAHQTGRPTQWWHRVRPALVQCIDCDRDCDRADAARVRWTDGGKFPSAAIRRPWVQARQSPDHENGSAGFKILAISHASRAERSNPGAHPQTAWGNRSWNYNKHSA